MPELPDVEVFSKNLDKALSGEKLIKVKVVNGKKLADTAKALSKNLDGKILKKIISFRKRIPF